MTHRITEPVTILYQDPAWRYTHVRDVKDGGMKYATMDLREMAKLDIGRLLAPVSACICWLTYPKVPEELAVLDAWGLEWVTVLFTWVKTNPNAVITTERVKDPRTKRMKDVITIDGGFKSGTGRHTNSNPEICVLFRKKGCKTPPRMHKNVKNLVIAPIGDHSVKPALYDRIELLYGVQNSLELWARPNPERPAHWQASGYELDGLDIRETVGFRKE